MKKLSDEHLVRLSRARIEDYRGKVRVVGALSTAITEDMAERIVVNVKMIARKLLEE